MLHQSVKWKSSRTLATVTMQYKDEPSQVYILAFLIANDNAVFANLTLIQVNFSGTYQKLGEGKDFPLSQKYTLNKG